MKIKQFAKKVLVGGTVTMGTAGLSTCSDNGAVDPAPPPLECPAVGQGQSLTASAVLAGTSMTVTIMQNNFDTHWTPTPVARDPVGATVQSVTLVNDYGPIEIALELAAPDTAAGEFTFEGELNDYQGNACAITRTFTFTIANGNVTVAQADPDLPLGTRGSAGIAMVRRDGLEVELEAGARSQGGRIAWLVTGGEFTPSTPGRMVWQLPEEPGLYQAELLIDYGQDGMAFDTLTLEVHPEDRAGGVNANA